MPHQRPSGAADEEEAAARIVAHAADEPADRKQAASKWVGSQMKEMIKLTTAKSHKRDQNVWTVQSPAILCDASSVGEAKVTVLRLL